MAGRSSGPNRSAYDHAVSLLARREHSRKDLAHKLERKGHSREEIAAALDRLVDEAYLSDQRFGEMLVRSRIRQCYGPMRIRAELRNHGLDDVLVERLLASTAQETDWDELAAAALRHRHGDDDADEFAVRGKRAAFLQRRGFPADIARRACHLD